MLATVTFVIFLGLLNRLLPMPPQTLNETEKAIPPLTMVFGVILGSIVAGVVEEGSFRGYMQGPIEKRHGPTIAILVTGLVFAFVHATHSYFSLLLLPYYMAVAAMYGALAYVTNSILPSLFMHAGLNIIGGLQTLAIGRPEWQESSRPLVWESGPDAMFWLSLIGTLIFGSLTVASYRSVAKVARMHSTI
jgi:membrane protease YdiL (CAAX protease family)